MKQNTSNNAEHELIEIGTAREFEVYEEGIKQGYAKAFDDVEKIIDEDADIQEYVKVRLKRKLSHSQTDFGVTKLTPSTDLLVHSQGKGTGRGIQSSKSADTHIPKESNGK